MPICFMTYIVSYYKFSLACLDYLGFNFVNFDFLIHDWFEREILLLLDNQGLSSSNMGKLLA